MKHGILMVIGMIGWLLEAQGQQVTPPIEPRVWAEADPAQLESIFSTWDNFVQTHPQDEQAWRNLYEAQAYLLRDGRKLRIQEHEPYLRAVVERMEKAIPDTYTYYECAYEYLHFPININSRQYRQEWDSLKAKRHEFALKAVDKMPQNSKDDTEWIPYLLEKQDTVRLQRMVMHYFLSGDYPAEFLQYDYNELQGMDEGAVFIAGHEGDLLGKLILQYVYGLHCDKVFLNMNWAYNDDHWNAVFRQVGMPPVERKTVFESEVDYEAYEKEHYRQELQQLLDCGRPIYIASNGIEFLRWRLEEAGEPFLANLYNEGLTLRYSPKPYDNMKVKRRNVEERYLMEYLLQPFQVRTAPRRWGGDSGPLGLNYVVLLSDLLPYYKKHNTLRYEWLRNLLTKALQNNRPALNYEEGMREKMQPYFDALGVSAEDFAL